MLNDTTPANEPGKEILGEIEKIKSQIEKRLKAYDEIDAALKAKNWNGAYEIAKGAHIDIYDPFATFREASEAVEKVDASIDGMRQKREELKQETEKIKMDEDVWRELEAWNKNLVDIQIALLKDSESNHLKFLEFLKKPEYKNLFALAEQLNVETEYLMEIDDPSKLRKIKKILVEGQSLEGEDFTWLYTLHQQISDSQIINRLYAKAEQRFLNQPEPVVAEDYQSNFDSIEKAFKESNQDEFRKAISALEKKLLDEENPLLRRVYQSDVHIWKQRLLAWEQAVKLVEEVLEFEEKVSQSANPENEWADEKNISTLVAALLDLRGVSPEIFVLKTDDKNLALGKSLDETLRKIASNLDNLESDLLGKNRKKADKSIVPDTVSEWRKYFKDIKPWLDEQEEHGQVFMSRLDKTPQPVSDTSNKNGAEFTPQPQSAR